MQTSRANYIRNHLQNEHFELMCYTFKSLLNISTNGALQNNNLLMKKKTIKQLIEFLYLSQFDFWKKRTNKNLQK